MKRLVKRSVHDMRFDTFSTTRRPREVTTAMRGEKKYYRNVVYFAKLK